MEVGDTKTQISSDPILSNRFDILKTLGEGAVGAVYLVRDREFDNRKVALKTMVNEIDLDENTHERFKQEIRILQDIDHPNIVKAYDMIENNMHIAYTMEYIDGHDLGSLYKTNTFDLDQIENIMVQLLSALSALHNKGVWHRDIKLENIMITNDGTVKLADLGLVKNEFNKGFTKTGVLLGTAQYMPPEYVKKGVYDQRGDLYAVGVVLFELMKKKRRFPNLPGNQIVDRLIKCKFKIPPEELEGIPPYICAVINNSVEPNLKLRYSTAEEMIEALHDKALKEQASPEVQAKASVDIQDLRKKIKPGSVRKDREKKLILVIISLFVLLILVGVFLL